MASPSEDNLDYVRTVVCDSLTGNLEPTLGYVISQVRRGKWNKWTKTPESIEGSIPVYTELEVARAALANFNEDRRNNFAIFPIILVAGEHAIEL